MHPNTSLRILRALRDRPGAEASRWLRRAEIQLQFARAFASLPAYRERGWEAAIDRAEARLDNYVPDDGIEELIGAVRAAEGDLAEIGQAAREYRIHCVGHGHIDMNWMWSWAETVSATHDTFASVLSLMEQYPNLTYSQSQASVYALMERHFPHLFEQIRQRVKEGRWEVTAAHWVEGDKNYASAEALCHHLLYTRSYFREKFGLSPEDEPIDWEPDQFGHANTIPDILAQGGIKYYYACRTGGGFDHPLVGEPRPRLFWWQGPDGSRILVNRESTWYNSYVNIGDNVALPMVAFVEETGLHDWLNAYGIGNHGGGPTRAEIDFLLELQDYPIYPQIVFSTCKRYFHAVEKELADNPALSLPTLDHELNFEFTGCYTSQSLIKQANRFGENYMVEAETLAALAAKLAGIPYPQERLREGWINVLFNQFHDILPGSGVRETREHALALFQETGAISGSIKRAAGGALAGQVDTLAMLPDTPEAAEERKIVEQGRANTPFVAGAGIGAGQTGYSVTNGGGRRFLPFVIYNPCAWTRSEFVILTLYDTDLDPGRIVALDETGAAHPTLFLGRGNDWGHDKVIVALPVRDIPPLGYHTYLICEGRSNVSVPTVKIFPGDAFETPYLTFGADRYRGGVRHLTDRRTGAQIGGFGTLPFGQWEYQTERPRGMTAWVLGGEVDEPIPLRAQYCHVHGAARNQGTAVPFGDSIAYRVESLMEVPGTNSTVRLQTVVHGLEPRIDVTAEIDWREIGDSKRGIPGLSIRFPLSQAVECAPARYETPFGSVERSLFNNEEVPTLRYAHLSGKTATGNGSAAPFGFTLLQDCKYGHAMQGSDLRLRIIRSSFDPDHAPEVVRETVRYSLYLHDAPADPATLTRLGAAWNHPLLVIPANLQSGTAAQRQGFAQLETPNVVLSAFKQAESGEGLILRLVELNGQDTEAVVTLAPALAAGLTRAAQTDLMERPTDGQASFSNNTLRVPVRAHSFVTVRLS
jgi:alpha-mannosidase